MICSHHHLSPPLPLGPNPRLTRPLPICLHPKGSTLVPLPHSPPFIQHIARLRQCLPVWLKLSIFYDVLRTLTHARLRDGPCKYSYQAECICSQAHLRSRKLVLENHVRQLFRWAHSIPVHSIHCCFPPLCRLVARCILLFSLCLFQLGFLLFLPLFISFYPPPPPSFNCIFIFGVYASLFCYFLFIFLNSSPPSSLFHGSFGFDLLAPLS